MDLRHADVYTQDVSVGVRTVRGSATAVPCLFGKAPRGSNPEEAAWMIHGWDEYNRLYGGYSDEYYLGFAVANFFLMAGSEDVSCVVKRAVPNDAVQAQWDATATGAPLTAFTLMQRFAGSYFSMDDRLYKFSTSAAGRQISGEMKITMEMYDGSSYNHVRSYDNVSLTASNRNFIKKVIGELDSYIDDDVYVSFAINDLTALGTWGIPGVTMHYTRSDWNIAGTESEVFDSLSATSPTSLAAFDKYIDGSILAAPDYTGATSIGTLVTYSEGRDFPMFVIGDFAADKTAATVVTETKDSINASDYLGLYWPHVYVNNPIDSTAKLIPPSGHVAGIMARTDRTRGVWKAPAGQNDGRLTNVIGLETSILTSELSELYEMNVNPIWRVPGVGPCVWGSRTHYVNEIWEQISIRRLFTQMAKDISSATRWAVFEPITSSIMSQLELQVWGYLKTLHSAGAFYDGGSKDWTDAFYVTCDTTNNTQISQRQKKLIIDWGAAPTYPAEFVIHRIAQWDGGRTIQEMTGSVFD